MLIAASSAALAAYVPAMPRAAAMQPSAARVGRVLMDGEADGDFGLAPGQKFGPTSPAHPATKCAR